MVNMQRQRSKIEENVLLAPYTTMKIGGIARYFTRVFSVEEMRDRLKECSDKGLPFFILGKGSNILFDDRGFFGLVLLNKIDHCSFEGDCLRVGAGYSFSLLGAQTARKGLAGLEFASGIPGTVGGAVFMNAGANGNETSDCLLSVDFVTAGGELLHLKKEDLKFSYRYSSFHEMKGAICAVTFSLKGCDLAKKKQRDLISYRKATQPYGEASAGCAFRNPQGVSAGRLIDECGLKDLSVGGACVSLLHGNFILNKGEASSRDVQELVLLIQQRVKERTGLLLEPEIRFISSREDVRVF